MKKLTILIIVIMVINALVYQPHHISFANPERITISEDRVNVRTGPGTGYDIIGQANRDEQYILLDVVEDGAGNVWYQIQFTTATLGFVSGRFAAIDQAAIEQPMGELIILAEPYLHVRDSAGLDSNIIGSLAYQSSVEYYSLEDGWYLIAFEDGQGYVSADFAQPMDVAQVSQTELVSQHEVMSIPKQVIVDTPDSKLNVRAEPNTTARIIGQLADRTVVNVYGQAGEWYEIRYEGMVGYIYAAYTIPVAEEPVDPSPVTSVTYDVFPNENTYKLSVPIIVTARAVGTGNAVYRFILKDAISGNVILTQDYSEDDSLIWTPQVAGNYSITIEAKNKTATSTQATANLSLSVENVVGSRFNYSIDYYGQTVDQAVYNQWIVSGRSVTDASGRWVQATQEQIKAAMDPLNYISQNYQKDRPELGTLTINYNLNVRPDASTSQAPYGTALLGEQYPVLDIYEGWFQIPFGDKAGWVSGDYVTYHGTGQPIPTSYSLNDQALPADVFQFLDLRHYTGMTSTMLNTALAGKGILAGQGVAFVDASKSASINEVYLVSHALLETGNGTSQLANGFWYNPTTDTILPYGSEAQPGFVKVYNMFGIGAFDSDPIGGGVRYAYKEDWTSPSKAIIGGAAWIAEGYINSPDYEQSTLYSMRYNIYENSHQYATDIGWAAKQTARMYQIYSLNATPMFRFLFPQFNILPAEVAIKNMSPAQNMIVRAGDVVDISFSAPPRGTASYIIAMPFSTYDESLPMTEVTAGNYQAKWTAPSDTTLDQAAVSFLFIDESGQKHHALAPGKISLSVAQVQRVAGTNRYETGAKISQETFTNSTSVVIASGHDFPDALVGGIYAETLEAPVLLTDPVTLPASVLTEIKRLGATKAYVLGGESAIKPSVVDSLKGAGLTVERIAGANRYETAVLISQQARAVNSSHAFLVSGTNYPDALSVVPIAARNNDAILLSGKDNLSNSAITALANWNIKSVTIVGGTNVISEQVSTHLSNLGYQVTRIAGANRYQTNIQLARSYYQGINEVVAASGLNFPDALVATVYAARRNAPIILVHDVELSGVTIEYLDTTEIYLGTILGGEQVIPARIERAILDLIR